MAKKQCWSCGTELDDYETFCPKCEAEQEKAEEEKTEQEKSEQEKSEQEETEQEKLVNKYLALIVFSPLLLILFCVGCQCIIGQPTSSSSEYANPTVDSNLYVPNTVQNKPVLPQLTQEEKNIQICKQIVKEYYENHKYMINTYDCDNMAQDVWNILQSKGIPAQIVTGNLELNEQNEQYSIEKTNHAWVIAYPGDNGGIALECTGGFVSYDSKYFSGFFFDDPQELRDYDKIYVNYINKYNEYQASIDYYNELVEKFNEQDGYTQQYMASGMIVAKNDVEFKEKEFDKARYRLEEANENLEPYN